MNIKICYSAICLDYPIDMINSRRSELGDDKLHIVYNSENFDYSKIEFIDGDSFSKDVGNLWKLRLQCMVNFINTDYDYLCMLDIDDKILNKPTWNGNVDFILNKYMYKNKEVVQNIDKDMNILPSVHSIPIMSKKLVNNILHFLLDKNLINIRVNYFEDILLLLLAMEFGDSYSIMDKSFVEYIPGLSRSKAKMTYFQNIYNVLYIASLFPHYSRYASQLYNRLIKCTEYVINEL